MYTKNCIQNNEGPLKFTQILVFLFENKPPGNPVQKMSLLSEERSFQGCQIFLGKTYQNGKNYTKLPQNIPNVHKLFQMAVKYCILSLKYINIFHCKTPSNFTQIWIFGSKINHLATLVPSPGTANLKLNLCWANLKILDSFANK
jgi:hypothetical protein